MLVAPDCEPDVQETFRKLAESIASDPGFKPGRVLGGLSDGVVYKVSNPVFTYKHWHEYRPADHYARLKANITLSEGLRRTVPLRRGKTAYTTPDYYAAYFPYEIDGGGELLWAMSFETGGPLHNLPVDVRGTVPTIKNRMVNYNKALAACGAIPEMYQLDMDWGNELYRIATDEERALGAAALTIIKLDIYDARFSSLGIDPDTFFK